MDLSTCALPHWAVIMSMVITATIYSRPPLQLTTKLVTSVDVHQTLGSPEGMEFVYGGGGSPPWTSTLASVGSTCLTQLGLIFSVAGLRWLFILRDHAFLNNLFISASKLLRSVSISSANPLFRRATKFVVRLRDADSCIPSV